MNLDYSEFLGRIAIARVFNGTLNRGAEVGISKLDGKIKTQKSPSSSLSAASNAMKPNKSSQATSSPSQASKAFKSAKASSISTIPRRWSRS